MYTNTIYKYSIKYPSSWILTDDTVTARFSNSEISKKLPTGFQMGDPIPGYYSIEISQHEVGSGEFLSYTTKEVYENLGTSKEFRVPFSDYFVKGTVENYNLNGISTKKVKRGGESTMDALLILRDDFIFEIDLYPYGGIKDKTINQILSTFKFTN